MLLVGRCHCEFFLSYLPHVFTFLYLSENIFDPKTQAQLEAKIKSLEEAFERDKENRQDYLEIQHRRKLKVKDQEISSLKDDLKTNKE